MKRHLLLFVCLLTLLSNIAVAEKAPKAVQAGVDDILKRYAIPGGVAAIVENGKVSLKVASGVRKQRPDIYGGHGPSNRHHPVPRQF
jgi:CubicO group peptidase (beta-lactamase class C family)